jgi:AcrR family transcriptional regulator
MSRNTRQRQSAAVKVGRPRNPRIQQRILKAATDLVLEQGFRALSMDAIAERAGVGRMTIYRRWPNKAAVVMDAFFARMDPYALFQGGKTYMESIRLQLRAVAKAYRGKEGSLIRILLAEAQFDPELASAIREKWILPRRRVTIPYLEQGIRDGFLREDLDPNVAIDLLYGPIYLQLLMGTATLSDSYIDKIFQHAMKGFKKA